MATITAVTAGHGTLVAATVDTVTLSAKTAALGPVNRVKIVNLGTGNIYFTTDGTTPTVKGVNTYVVLSATEVTVPVTSSVKLISAGTPDYAVQIVPGS